MAVAGPAARVAVEFPLCHCGSLGSRPLSQRRPLWEAGTSGAAEHYDPGLRLHAGVPGGGPLAAPARDTAPPADRDTKTAPGRGECANSKNHRDFGTSVAFCTDFNRQVTPQGSTVEGDSICLAMGYLADWADDVEQDTD